jgi:hypothetical protein
MLRVEPDNFLNVNKIPMLTDFPLPLDNAVIPNTPFAMALIGAMGSGKTNLLCHLMLGGDKGQSQFYNKHFDKVFFVGQLKTINTKKKINLPEDQVFETLTSKVLDAILEDVKNSNESVLLVIDDQINQLKKPDIRPYMCKIIYNMRHLCASGDKTTRPHGMHIMITSQKYNKIPKEIRTVMSHLAVFKPSKTDMKEIHEEQLSIDYNVWENICKMVFDKSHQFLFYNARNSSFYKNFKKIEISGLD